MRSCRECSAAKQCTSGTVWQECSHVSDAECKECPDIRLSSGPYAENEQYLTVHNTNQSNTCQPDLAWSYSELSKYVQYPGQAHMDAALHVLRYLRGIYDQAILFQHVDTLRSVCTAPSYVPSNLAKRFVRNVSNVSRSAHARMKSSVRSSFYCSYRNKIYGCVPQ